MELIMGLLGLARAGDAGLAEKATMELKAILAYAECSYILSKSCSQAHAHTHTHMSTTETTLQHGEGLKICSVVLLYQVM